MPKLYEEMRYRSMKMNKYCILFDYHSEGFSFATEGDVPGEYETVAEAVKAAIDKNYATPFLIVQVIEWEAAVKT